MNDFIQVMILILSGFSFWLATGISYEQRKKGAIIGILAQVFWLIETARRLQWGMFILSLWYVWIFIRIILNEDHFARNRSRVKFNSK